MQLQRAPGQLTLAKSAFLYRRWEFQDWDGMHTLEYNGRGIGYESVLVDGVEVCRVPSHAWFVPRFDFTLAGRPTTLLISISPWEATRITIWQGTSCLYHAGQLLTLDWNGSSATRTGSTVFDDDGLIDQGPCLLYFQLSYRRRIIRSLWMAVLSPLILLMLLLPGMSQTLVVYLFLFSVVGSLFQALWNYFVFRGRR